MYPMITKKDNQKLYEIQTTSRKKYIVRYDWLSKLQYGEGPFIELEAGKGSMEVKQVVLDPSEKDLNKIERIAELLKLQDDHLRNLFRKQHPKLKLVKND